MKALEKDRRRRYETAIAFSQDIRRCYEECPSPLALAIRAELEAWHSIYTGSQESATKAMQDIKAAQLILGDSPFVLLVSMMAHHAAYAVAEGVSEKERTLEEAMVVAGQLV